MRVRVRSPRNHKTRWAALHFTFITGLTVGYGDILPTTILGRIVSVLIALIGLLFFGIVVAVANRAVAKTLEERQGIR